MKQVTHKPDICIVGAGSTGLSLAAACAAFGVDVVLIEKGKMGGDCLNLGCIPSKSLIAAAHQAHVARTSRDFGIRYAPPNVNFQDVHDHIHSVIAAIAPVDSQERFESLGVTVLREKAKFIDDRTMSAGEQIIWPRRFVLATGSSVAGQELLERLTRAFRTLSGG